MATSEEGVATVVGKLPASPPTQQDEDAMEVEAVATAEGATPHTPLPLHVDDKAAELVSPSTLVTPTPTAPTAPTAPTDTAPPTEEGAADADEPPINQEKSVPAINQEKSVPGGSPSRSTVDPTLPSGVGGGQESVHPVPCAQGGGGAEGGRSPALSPDTGSSEITDGDSASASASVSVSASASVSAEAEVVPVAGPQIPQAELDAIMNGTHPEIVAL